MDEITRLSIFCAVNWLVATNLQFQFREVFWRKSFWAVIIFLTAANAVNLIWGLPYFLLNLLAIITSLIITGWVYFIYWMYFKYRDAAGQRIFARIFCRNSRKN